VESGIAELGVLVGSREDSIADGKGDPVGVGVVLGVSATVFAGVDDSGSVGVAVAVGVAASGSIGVSVALCV